MPVKRWGLMLGGSGALVLLATAIALAAAPATPAPLPPGFAALPGVAGPIGKAVVPLMYAGAFFILANAMLHLNPDRSKVSVVSVGTVGLVTGIIFLANVYEMMSGPDNLGPLTNFVAALGTMYGFFFTTVGINQMLGVKQNVLGPIAILIGWMTLAIGVFWLMLPGHPWVYHFSITLVWFIAMNLAGLYQVGKMPEKVLGYWLLLTAVYTFAIPAFLWTLPGGFQGPFYGGKRNAV